MIGGGSRLGTLALATAVTGLAAAGGCHARSGPGSGAPGKAGRDTVRGTVRQVGSTPFQRTVVESEERTVVVTGEPEVELRRLVGARVEVVGEIVEGDATGPTLIAAGYRILSLDGREPRVGTLLHAEGEGYLLETEEGERIVLRGVPASLAEKVGARIWAVLDRGGSLQRYGILREP